LKVSIEEIKQYFPYDKPREIQSDVICDVLTQFKNGKRFAVIECGTGVGKSAIGFTIANYINNNSNTDYFPSEKENGAYFLTTQKILQDQYENDFSSKGMLSLYSSSNYTCSVDKKATCKDILTGLRTQGMPKAYDCCNYKCQYKSKKKLFREEDLGVTNFSYFLTEKNYSKVLPNKKVLIIDEAHNLESELTRFIEISVSEYFAEKILKIKIPKEINTQFKAFKWIKEVYSHSVNKKVDFVKSQLEKFGLNSSKIEEFKKITNRFEMLTNHQAKINQFINDILNPSSKIQDNKDLIEKSFESPLKEAREHFEKEYLTTQLKKHHGNISKTADFIGMERSALHRKLKSLGIKGIN